MAPADQRSVCCAILPVRSERRIRVGSLQAVFSWRRSTRRAQSRKRRLAHFSRTLPFVLEMWRDTSALLLDTSVQRALRRRCPISSVPKCLGAGLSGHHSLYNSVCGTCGSRMLLRPPKEVMIDWVWILQRNDAICAVCTHLYTQHFTLLFETDKYYCSCSRSTVTTKPTQRVFLHWILLWGCNTDLFWMGNKGAGRHKWSGLEQWLTQ